MSRWVKGEATIEEFLADRELETIVGTQADGRSWIDKARRMLKSASELTGADPDSAYVLAHDAARFACTALLAQQGLRATTQGGHYVVDVTVRKQFGGPFNDFGGLRRQRNELEYPTLGTEVLRDDDAEDAVAQAGELIDTAEQMLPHLGFFRSD